MNPEVKKLWVEALRSGNFKQGRGFLQPTEDKYCCLGVLCRLPGSPRENEKRLSGSFPGKDVYDWSSLIFINALVEMNDVEEKSFDKIADYIEANL